MNATTYNPYAQADAYCAELEAQDFKFPFANGATFVKGIREIGYKNTAWALGDLIDNSIEADASQIHVLLNTTGADRGGNVNQIAVIDNGIGMKPTMLRAAMIWGGTSREVARENRVGIGRFGYGLPTASMSQGKVFEVFSSIGDGNIYSSKLDLVVLESKKSLDGGVFNNPEPQITKLPKFVQDYISHSDRSSLYPNGVFRGTVVVIGPPVDKLTWRSARTLRSQLLGHFGVMYQKLLPRLMGASGGLFVHLVGQEIKADEEKDKVEPIDPLFLTPGHRYFDEDSERATALDPLTIDVKEDGEAIGQVTVRYAWAPMTFGVKDKTVREKNGKVDMRRGRGADTYNGRWPILRDYNGVLVYRQGRLIDILPRIPGEGGRFQNDDKYIRVEISFDAVLDEYFHVPTKKDQVLPDEKIWDALSTGGIIKALSQMRALVDDDRLARAAKVESATERPSEAAMAEVAKIAKPLPPMTKAKIEDLGKKRLQQEIQRRAKEHDLPIDVAEKVVTAEIASGPYKVREIANPIGAFFWVEQMGGTMLLNINTSTKFYTQIYRGPDSSPAVRAALELLLFSIGESKLAGSEEIDMFYNDQIVEWSRKIEVGLTKLSTSFAISDAVSPDDFNAEEQTGEKVA